MGSEQGKERPADVADVAVVNSRSVLLNGKSAGVKILGEGELNKKLTVCANAFSATAKSKIEAKGGTCELIAAKKAEKK